MNFIVLYSSPLARILFDIEDEPILKNQFDDNQKIEPEWYIPIIPMVLVNGTDGIGTGWSTKIQNYNPREIVNNILRMLDGQEPLPMVSVTGTRSKQNRADVSALKGYRKMLIS